MKAWLVFFDWPFYKYQHIQLGWAGGGVQLPAFWRYFFLFSHFISPVSHLFKLLLSGLSNVPQSSALSVCRGAHRWHDGPLTGNKLQGPAVLSYQKGCTTRDKTSVAQQSAHQTALGFSAESWSAEVITSGLYGRTPTFFWLQIVQNVS